MEKKLSEIVGKMFGEYNDNEVVKKAISEIKSGTWANGKNDSVNAEHDWRIRTAVVKIWFLRRKKIYCRMKNVISIFTEEKKLWNGKQVKKRAKAKTGRYSGCDPHEIR